MDSFVTLSDKIASRTAHIGIIGLGYVGMPLAAAVAKAGFRTTGFDVDSEKIRILKSGVSYISAVSGEDLAALMAQSLFAPSDTPESLRDCDIIIACVPTPLTKNREPDLSFVVQTTEMVAGLLRPGQIYILESTTYPGTTTGLVKPILQRSGLISGVDFFIGYSPEREDPGNARYETTTIPKIVSGDGPEAQALVAAFYAQVVAQTVPVSSPDVAEAVKLTENIFRAVNIALVNELKMVFTQMDIDIWEVITAAKTKPFGYMAFYPGPGLGGHCVPIDPFYLTWAAKAHQVPTRFIELAGEINTRMPRYIVECLALALDQKCGRGLNGARILILGVAYKKNVADIRESPSLVLFDLLEARGAEVSFHDPFVPVIPATREHGALAGRKSVGLAADELGAYAAVLVATDHSSVDYAGVAAHAALVVDTRNVMERHGFTGPHIVKA